MWTLIQTLGDLLVDSMRRHVWYYFYGLLIMDLAIAYLMARDIWSRISARRRSW